VTAVVAGVARAGLSMDELCRLVDPKTGTRKVGSSDLAPVLAAGGWGATTVSASCALADAAEIRLFATGGVGGVHRGAERTFDVSQDLLAISRARVAVVTSGAKAILDLPKTLEALETLGVPVVGYGTAELPAFYTRGSGLPLEHRVEDASQAAAILRSRWEVLAQGGVIFANPVPKEAEADPALVARAIEDALSLAAAQQVVGKALTPFLLSQVAQRTGGASLKANLALLRCNAGVAAQIAVVLAGRRS